MTVESNERVVAPGRRRAPLTFRNDGPVPYRSVGTLSATKKDPTTSEPTYLIKATGTDVLQFGEKEYFLWRLLDGTNSAGDIQRKFGERFGVTLTPEQLGSFIDQLVNEGAVERYRPGEGGAPSPNPTPMVPPAVVAAAEPIEAELPSPAARWARSAALFDPSAGLRALDSLCGPVRFFGWLLLPAVVGVLLWFELDASAMAWDVSALAPVQALAAAFLGLLIVGIVPPLAQAAAASFFGYATPACRIASRFGVPRLVFDDSAWTAMLAAHVLRVVAMPCLARLALSAGGIGLWLATRGSHEGIAALGLAIGVLGLASFLTSTAPFLPTQGRRWLATTFGGVDPWSEWSASRGHAAVLSVFWLAVAGGVLAVAAVAALQALHASWYDPATTEVVRTTAVPLLIVIAVATRFWIRGLVSGENALQPSYAYVGWGPQAFDPVSPMDGGLRQSRMLFDAAGRPPRRQGTGHWAPTTTIRVWAIILFAIVAILFLAYPYEAGGYFTILPYDSAQLNARVQGELTEVLVNEGDTVKPGQILGVLSDWQQKYNLAAAKAQLENAQATLQNVLHQPEWEAVELARKQYEAALSRLPYDKAQFERYAALVTNDNVSRANYDQVLSQYQQDQAAAEVARANYDSVRTGPTPDQIEAQRALVRQYTATVAFDEDELERTRIRANSYGTMVTQNPLLLRGKWFAQGALVFTVEDHRVLQADVQVPETDVDNVRLGTVVRLRLWGTPEKTALGKAIAFAPDGQTATSANPQDVQSGSSNVIRVRAVVPNPDGTLYPNTDGYAKMPGYYMPTWRAFGQLIERFFLVEIWSWIP